MNKVKIIQIGPYLVKPDTLQVAIVDENRKVEPKVMAAMEFFIQRPNQLISRDELITHVWQGASVSDGAVNRTIAQIRRLFEHPEHAINVIETIPKRGYQWVASCEPFSSEQQTDNVNFFKSYRWLSVSLVSLIMVGSALLLLNNIENNEPHLFKIVNRLTSMPGQEKYPFMAPNNRWLTFSHRTMKKPGWDLYVKDILTEERIQLTNNNDADISAVWSNSGDKLVFTRLINSDGWRCGIYLVEFSGKISQYKPEVKIADCGAYSAPGIAWGKNDQVIYYNDRNSNSESYKVIRLALTTGQKSQLILPMTTGSGFRSVAISSKGLLAVAERLGAGKSKVIWYDMDKEAVINSMLLNKYIGAMGWYQNDSQLLISANDGYWSIQPGQEPEAVIIDDADRLGLLTTSYDGRYLITKEAWHVENIHRIANFNQSSGGQKQEQQWTTSSQIERYPQAANTSQRLIYFSNRSGKKQIWLQDEAGMNTQLTYAPDGLDFSAFKWSPSDKFIVLRHQQAIWKLNIETKQLEKILDKSFAATNPSWGKSDNEIIVASKQTGDWQLWHINLLTNQKKQVTIHGGYSARTLSDGTIYFTKYHHNGLYKLIDFSGTEVLVLEEVSNINWKTWQLFPDGFYYNKTVGKQRGILFYNFDTLERTLAKPIAKSGGNEISISFDQKHLYFSKVESSESDIVKIE